MKEDGRREMNAPHDVHQVGLAMITSDKSASTDKQANQRTTDTGFSSAF